MYVKGCGKVLVIVDMQKDFITGPLGNAECDSAAENAVSVIRDREYELIVRTMDTHGKNYLSTQEGRRLPVEHCIKGTDGWKLDERVASAIEESRIPVIIVEKGQFGHLGLSEEIKYGGVNLRSVDIIGVCTDICVVSNALIIKSGLPEIPISVIAKACGGTSPEAHEAALRTMQSCHIDIER